ncbi:MAG: hypothetical protein OXE82_08525 [Rhodobacter sp.]|nr:hypothetical protein [Rhodobacter sp.]
MATEDRIPTDLTIDPGDGLAPDEFLAAVKNFLGYVAEITNAQSGDGADVAWTVRVRGGVPRSASSRTRARHSPDWP